MDGLGPLDPRKRIASLFLLPHCDMSCRFCASEPGFAVMAFEQAADLLRRLREAGIDNVVLGGGEPFLWPHGLRRLTRLARDLGYLVQVCTNGVSLPEGFERWSSIDRYILPLESMDPAVHDRLRSRLGGHHTRVLERIETLAGSGRELTVSTVVTRENLNRLSALAEFLERLRARGVKLHAWHLYRFLPVGRGGEPNAESLRVSHEDFVGACAEVKRSGLGFRVYRRDDMLSSRSVEFFWIADGRVRVGSRQASSSRSWTDGAG